MTPTYWHMQMHPNEREYADKNAYYILEHKKIIGMGCWPEGEDTISVFVDKMEVNDIVAIKTGRQLVALVQVIGGAYRVEDDTSEFKWIKNRRPIRVLDWALNEETLPHAQGTLNRCVRDDKTTTKIIKDWHERVVESFKKRQLDIFV
ncbi:pyruvate kinase [Achromobacter mucicolens]|uniref:Pyruvate kinase n=1 Tax=Achromobacter mucicolens TaxID=1389922 RepID=A0ABM8L7J9_9BURK|nr:pyruvate kinase [Achromobacter mucicolens]CAB3824374.1 hypothetical protein LMG3415_00576 [Achromobacter mucicolens]